MEAERLSKFKSQHDTPELMFEYHRFTYSRDDIERGLIIQSHTGKLPLNPRKYDANSHDEVDWSWLKDVTVYKKQLRFFADTPARKAAGIG